MLFKVYQLRTYVSIMIFAISTCAVPPTENGGDKIYTDPARPIEDRVEDLLSRMSLAEKIGQMTLPERQAFQPSTLDDIKTYFIGAVLDGGGATPTNLTPAEWLSVVNEFKSRALETPLQIPLIYGIDAVHGHNKVDGAVVFPHNVGMGCMRNSDLVEEAAAVTAREVAATGIDWTFSPCVAVARDERWGRTYEGFGETPGLVKEMAYAAVRGYQGTDLSADNTILACAKHFVGDGGTTGGVDQGDIQLDEQSLRELHLAGYVEAIKAGVGTIMASFSSWNGQKTHGDDYLLTTVLKEELGFDGFLVSDWAGIDQLPGDYASDVGTAINAGLDMIMVPFEYKLFISTLKDHVQNGSVSLARIDDAVRRILRIKFMMGLFDKDITQTAGVIGTPEHREVARECVRQSVVLLKNTDNLLPLGKDLARIHVAGKSADDIGIQCGGWTIIWQGSAGPITPGTTILEGIQETVSDQTSVTYSLDGSGAAGADVGIVVVGETPYAEGYGDRTDLSLSEEDLAAIGNVKAAGMPVVVILISGRPLSIADEIENWDALVAAWLPGTEGQGVSDVLFGDFSPTGKSSHTWPRTMNQIPINLGDPDYNPLFEYGFGLSWPTF
ncbi:MAG: glycoside hydrolase family 3 C-terminal domain-containing protein [Fidelibacterota bacterium]|nr:MAG: glycoside hydrolase family 3 C-terminal domain-containing protein [Candidatus Neomarinimicrobiota bacterium]